MNIQNNESIFGKPILFEESIVFDLAGNPLIHSHPIIVFYDQDEDEYWYVGARSAFDNKGNERVPFKEEIKIKASKEGLFKKDSLIDTSKIYRINRQLFHSLNIENINLYHLTKEISDKDIRKILRSICNNAYVGEISIAEIFWDDKNKELSQNLEYCGQEVIDEAIERLTNVDEPFSLQINSEIISGTKFECYNRLKNYILNELNEKNEFKPHYVSEIVGEFGDNFSSKTGIYDYVNGYEYTPDNRFNPFNESTSLNYKESKNNSKSQTEESVINKKSFKM